MCGFTRVFFALRKNFVVLWSPSGLAGRGGKRKPASKIKKDADLAGHRVGLIGVTPPNCCGSS
jgi:hypothetical protein